MMAIERFIAKIRFDSNGCWVWTGHRRGAGGYGGFGNIYAHRFAFEYWKYPIPEDEEIDHICEERRCVNPEHLQSVSRKRNIQLSWIRRKARKQEMEDYANE